MRRKVEFATEDGTILRGHIHSEGTDPAPGIVMAHGFGGVHAQSVRIFRQRAFATAAML